MRVKDWRRWRRRRVDETLGWVGEDFQIVVGDVVAVRSRRGRRGRRLLDPASVAAAVLATVVPFFVRPVWLFVVAFLAAVRFGIFVLAVP